MADEEDYVLRAKEQLRDLLDTELALIMSEAIARLGEQYHAGDTRGHNLDSHIVGLALQELQTVGETITAWAISKGGHRIDTIQPADQKLRKTAITTAARRKQALYARYLGWAEGSKRYPHGFIGPDGEEATRAGILASVSLQPVAPGAGPVSRVLGVNLPGAADSGGFMNPVLNSIPQPPVTVLFEVKNIRSWIYPSSSELFQVLHKCVILQQANPTVPIVPILVCRKAHKTTFYMASQLGFIVIDMGTQFVGDNVGEQALLEVRNALAFSDLRLGTGPSLRVRDRLSKNLPAYIHQYAATWATTALDTEMSPRLSRLSRKLLHDERTNLLNEIRSFNRANGKPGGW
jgi:hypothetical protein